MDNNKNQIRINLKKTYLKVVKNCIGSNQFRNLYATVNGEEKDILNDGDLSCAIFVSQILLISGLITKVHATVKGTVADMESTGWVKIEEPKKGAVLVWDNSIQDEEGNWHDHIGFYIGNDLAISNSKTEKTPQQHFWTFGKEGENDFRKVVAIYWNEKLD